LSSDAENGKPGQGREPLVRLRNLSRKFGNAVAVRPLDLDIYRGDFLALLGPSGCGKTTLLRMIGGFLEPTTGSIEIAGEDVTRFGPERRKTNMVFQSYGLFPHMSVGQNIAYGLRLAGRSKKEIAASVAAMIDLVHLAGLAERYPEALSGGQQQRVALARALVMEPAVLLLDESLGALDLKLRRAMQGELRQLHKSIGGTFLFVTHDQSEALALANRIAVMQDGCIVQIGKPEEIYSSPTTEFVAGFIGEANMFPGRRNAGRVRLDAGAELADPGPDGAVVAVVRPDAMRLARGQFPVEVSFAGILRDRVYLGNCVSYKVELPGGREVVVHRAAPVSGDDVEPGEAVVVGWQSGGCRVVAAG